MFELSKSYENKLLELTLFAFVLSFLFVLEFSFEMEFWTFKLSFKIDEDDDVEEEDEDDVVDDGDELAVIVGDLLLLERWNSSLHLFISFICNMLFLSMLLYDEYVEYNESVGL